MLQEIIDCAVDSSTGIGELLRRCRIMASQLSNEELEKWLSGEMYGYPDDAQLPDYRIWPQIIKGNFAGPLGASLMNTQIPPASIPQKWRERVMAVHANDSASAIEATLRESDNAMIRTDQGNLSVVLGSNVYSNANCISAWGEFHRSRFIGVIEAVRNRVLEFALALQGQYPGIDSANEEERIVPREWVNQGVHMLMTGGTLSIVGHTGDAVTSADVSSRLSEEQRGG